MGFMFFSVDVSCVFLKPSSCSSLKIEFLIGFVLQHFDGEICSEYLQQFGLRFLLLLFDVRDGYAVMHVFCFSFNLFPNLYLRSTCIVWQLRLSLALELPSHGVRAHVAAVVFLGYWNCSGWWLLEVRSLQHVFVFVAHTSPKGQETHWWSFVGLVCFWVCGSFYLHSRAFLNLKL